MQEDLESEFISLHAVLDEMKENMLTRIKQERASRTYEMQVAVIVSRFEKYTKAGVASVLVGTLFHSLLLYIPCSSLDH